MEELGFRRTLVIFVGLQLGQVMSSLDGTIVATALPTIVDDVGGFSRVTWVVSAYSLAMVASMPLYGKLGDLYGRRRVLLGAIGIFLVGSMACGLAQTMDQLLVARFVQGLGGGGLGAVAMATIADIVPARELGRWLGYQGMIYAIASVVGPIVGGLFVDHLSWRWAFLVNLPVGLVAVAIVATRLRLPVAAGAPQPSTGRARRCSRPASPVRAGGDARRPRPPVASARDAGPRGRCRGPPRRVRRAASGGRRSRCCRCGCSRDPVMRVVRRHQLHQRPDAVVRHVLRAAVRPGGGRGRVASSSGVRPGPADVRCGRRHLVTGRWSPATAATGRGRSSVRCS